MNETENITEEFHTLRRTGLGGSDAAVAIGLSPWRTPYDLWLEKTGESEPRPATEPMLWGVLLEPVIADEYARRTGRALQHIGMLRHPVHSWMIGHIDRLIVGEPRILEVKTAHDSRGWGEPGTDQVPIIYSAQTHHYLTVSGAEIADLAVLIGGSDFRIYTVQRDDFITDHLIEQEAAFWQSVERREPPPPIQLSDVVHRWGRLAVQGAVVADRIELLAIEELRRIRDHRATLDAMEDANKLVVLKALADKGEALTDDSGNLLATWKLDGGRKGYTVEPRPPSRRFLLKG